MEERVPLVTEVEERRLNPRQDFRNPRFDDVPDGEMGSILLDAELNGDAILARARCTSCRPRD